MNKLEENQIWEVKGIRVIIGDVLPVSVKIFSTLTGKLEFWLHSEILLYGNMVE